MTSISIIKQCTPTAALHFHFDVGLSMQTWGGLPNQGNLNYIIQTAGIAVFAKVEAVHANKL